MLLEWFNVREICAVGNALADQFAPQSASGRDARSNANTAARVRRTALPELLRRAERETRILRLNIYKRAKLANVFKWRLLENGVERELAEEVTRALVVHLSQSQTRPSIVSVPTGAVSSKRTNAGKVQDLLDQGDQCSARGAYVESIPFYEELVRLKPHHAHAYNSLGAAYSRLGQYREAEVCFRRAIAIKPRLFEAHSNLGALQQWKGHLSQSETSLRRALKSRPGDVNAQTYLGWTLLLQGRLDDATGYFERVLKVSPRYAEALLGMGQIAAMEGRFDEGASFYNRALAVNPKMSAAVWGVVGLRRMGPSDARWLERAEEIANNEIAPVEEANARFAMGKYCDDVGDFQRAFKSYQRANVLLKTLADDYDRAARARFVDDMVRVYTPAVFSKAAGAASDSARPVFVVGMPRSGTSLAEQIIASLPAAKGAGELGYWNNALRRYESDIRQGVLTEPSRKKLAAEYLRLLASRSADALRVVDKTPVNADYLGMIHSVFPNAKIIYLRRDPKDTCLSCYFQRFSPALNYTMDLSDLAHYYREHERLMAHWFTVLPSGTILEVPYEELVVDQEAWTRRMLDFIGLEWDPRCLDFQNTSRPVSSASFWQVRQKIYNQSVGRWRNYQKWIGPLRELGA
ncbi:MAG: tetratricopeptide repeat-containing sulfotransferase family protein [Terriglobales bacterium]